MRCKRPNCGLPILALLMAPCLLAGCAASLHDAVAHGDAVKVRALLAVDPEGVHARNEQGKTPLHYAVAFKQKEMMALLVEAGADLDARDITGMTPLHVAAMLGRADEAAWLIGAGASVEVPDTFGDRPLHTAALFGQGLVLKRLLDAGARASEPNNKGETPWSFARKRGDEKMRVYLEKRGAGPQPMVDDEKVTGTR